MNLLPWTILVCLLWGIGPICQKTVLKKVTIGAYFVYSSIFIIAVQLFYIWYFQDEARKSFNKIGKTEIFLIFISTIVCTIFAGFIFAKLLKEDKDSYTINTITSAYPMVTILIAWLFMKEKINLSIIIGAILITLGIIIIGNQKKAN